MATASARGIVLTAKNMHTVAPSISAERNICIPLRVLARRVGMRRGKNAMMRAKWKAKRAQTISGTG